MGKGEWESEKVLFQTPGNTSEVKCTTKGGGRETRTGNVNNCFRNQRKSRKEMEWEEEKRKGKQDVTVPLKASAEEVCVFMSI